MKKIFLIFNVALIIAVFIGNYFYMTVGGTLLKGLCSGGFALIGLLNLTYAILSKQKNLKFNIVMAIGLIFAMLGDIVLDFHFIGGAALFAVGHIFYLIAYCILKKIGRLDFIIGGIIAVAAGAFVLFCPLINYSEPFMKWVCCAYAVIISMMVGKAISNFVRERNVLYLILMVGSILFFISDLMLLLRWFMGLGAWAGKVCLATYYPAECALAYGTFHFVESRKKSQKANVE